MAEVDEKDCNGGCTTYSLQSSGKTLCSPSFCIQSWRLSAERDGERKGDYCKQETSSQRLASVCLGSTPFAGLLSEAEGQCGLCAKAEVHIEGFKSSNGLQRGEGPWWQNLRNGLMMKSLSKRRLKISASPWLLHTGEKAQDKNQNIRMELKDAIAHRSTMSCKSEEILTFNKKTVNIELKRRSLARLPFEFSAAAG